jgi:pimeloyl-ACP methyl ester carboxylesterase
MKRQHTLWLAVVTATAVAGGIMFIGARAQTVADPETARCNTPAVKFGAVQSYPDRREVEVHFTCVGEKVAGTLTIPPGPGRHPAAVWVHGSGETTRLTYSGAPLVRELVHAGIAVLSYDKRGVGDSTGHCCPGDDGHFNLLAADAAGALQAVTSRREIDPTRVGFIGASQAGWVVPLAVSRLDHPVAFTALVDAPVVSRGQEQLYSELTGEEGGHATDLSQPATIERVRDAGPSDFDPEPLLSEQPFPSLWLYGGQDQSQPTTLDLEVLTRLSAGNNGIKTIVFPEADHGLLDIPPSDPNALPTFVRWIQRTVEPPRPQR